ncbi:hypothetical protein LCGC14_1211210 [marine sediment metagenome]|uniref:Uncharacterized protein n=1 Tax=marine sediment metagenome TaxID=412755 RepID=A0A0F9PIJ7_9ZZZZ
MSVDIRSEAPGIGLASVWLGILRMLPFAKQAYNRSLRNLMDEKKMSPESFRHYHQYLLGLVRLTKKNSMEFRNRNRETEDILRHYPRLNAHKGAMLERVKAHRRKCNLS